MKLNKSLVEFNEVLHQYMYEGRELSGITGMLHRIVFPDMYAGVDEATLARAAEHGTMVHNNIEMQDELGVIGSILESATYARLIQDAGLTYECSEYTVSDYQHYASNIDKVFRVNSTHFILADLKTTYTLNKEYVRWQLSIYAYLFELINPACHVDKLLAIWLRGEEGQIVELQRIDKEIILQLFDADINGKPFTNPFHQFPKGWSNRLKSLRAKMGKLKELEEQIEADKKELMTLMQESGSTKWESKWLTATRTSDTESVSFDSKKFQSDNPELYKQYQKKTTRKGYIKLTDNLKTA